ncbi:MAG: DUF4330 domain-containing protein [Bacillota bacterium]|nr:MAG: DUF4330 domain-containing protein [Bacillota bacterium]
MKLLDEHGRLFGRVNLVNAVVALVVVAAVAAGAYKLMVVEDTGVAETGEVIVTFEVRDVRQPSVDAVSVGETVYGFETQIPLGPVVEKRAEPHLEPVVTADGRVVMAEVPGHFDLFLVVRGRAAVGPRAISLSGRELKIGIELSVTGRLFSFKSTIVGLEETGR